MDIKLCVVHNVIRSSIQKFDGKSNSDCQNVFLILV